MQLEKAKLNTNLKMKIKIINNRMHLLDLLPLKIIKLLLKIRIRPQHMDLKQNNKLVKHLIKEIRITLKRKRKLNSIINTINNSTSISNNNKFNHKLSNSKNKLLLDRKV